jgi:hypothetical protein
MPDGQPDINARLKALSPQDWMVVGGGGAAFIFSLFPFVGVSFGPISYSVNAWHSYALLGVLLILAAAVTWTLRALDVVKLPPVPEPWTWSRIIAATSGLGSLLVLIRGLTIGSSGVAAAAARVGVNVGMRFGGYALVVAGVVMTVGAVLADRSAPKSSPR